MEWNANVFTVLLSLGACFISLFSIIYENKKLNRSKNNSLFFKKRSFLKSQNNGINPQTSSSSLSHFQIDEYDDNFILKEKAK